ncbi:MAG: hypothetical protein IPJ56_09315 [Gemmatimonadetes bacterium]|nr:hypothetical protein [Gemmatimonadota bacterium]
MNLLGDRLLALRPRNGAVYPQTDFGKGCGRWRRSSRAMPGSGGAHGHRRLGDARQPGADVGDDATLMQDFSNSVGAFWADVMQGPAAST